MQNFAARTVRRTGFHPQAPPELSVIPRGRELDRVFSTSAIPKLGAFPESETPIFCDLFAYMIFLHPRKITKNKMFLEYATWDWTEE